jgi:hypothetical protein
MMNLVLLSIFVRASNELLTYRKILRHGTDGFTSLPNEGELRILLLSAGIEPAYLRSNGNHASHYTTEDD